MSNEGELRNPRSKVSPIISIMAPLPSSWNKSFDKSNKSSLIDSSTLLFSLLSRNSSLMSWFGGGGGKSDSNGGGSYQPENSYQDQSFVGQQESYSAPRAAAGSAESFQQELMLEQQKALIQAVMFKLTDTAFKKCITQPSTSLSSCKISRIYITFNLSI